MTNTYAGYVRVSSEEQRRQGLSPSYQEERIKSYVESKEGTIHRIYQDLGKSGGSVKGRKEFQQMLKDAKEGQFNHIVVLRLDRFSRSIRDVILLLDELKEKGIQLQTVSGEIDTTTPQGELFLHFSAMLAQFERRMAKKRTEEIHLMKVEKGMPVSPPPYGYKWKNKQWVINPSEAEVVRKVFQMVAAGVKPKDLHASLPISRNHLYSILKNRAYLGKLIYKGEEYDGKHEPIVDEVLWEAASKNYYPHELEPDL